MKKKIVNFMLSTVLVSSLLIGCGNNANQSGTTSTNKSSANSKAGNYDLTLYSINTTDPDFESWLQNVETATGLKINVIAAPTDSDTRQQKITTILSTGDSSVDILEINDEMSASFKNSGWLEGLNDTVMTDDIRSEFAKGYLDQMRVSRILGKSKNNG